MLAIDSATNSTASVSRRFHVDTAPPTRPILGTKNGNFSTTLVTETWLPSNDSVTALAFYIVQIDTAGTFTFLVESTTIAYNVTSYLSAVINIDTYYWRVLAYDSAGNFSISSPIVDSFRIISSDTTPPSAFALTAPQDLAETLTTTITLRWADSLDSSPPVRYQVQVDTVGTFFSNIIDTTNLLDTFLVATFPANDTFFWRVIAKDNAGNTVAAGSTRRIVVDT
ncbi:MAG: hypothetical protein AAB250_09735, partial [Bdellovibrionota bacterium]